MSTTDTPRVTVITPCYNRAQFLESTILSVLKQSYPFLQYIVIDGGSTDDSVKIIQKYATNLAYWVSEPDDGQTHAINKGFRVAQGDILTWLNADDLLLPGAISAAVECFKGHPEVGVIYGDCQVVDEAGQLIFERKVCDYNWGVLLYARSMINQPASFFRRSVLEEIGLLDERFSFCMDLEFWARAARQGIVFKMLPVLLASFRLHASSKTAMLRQKMISEHRRILEMYSPIPWRSLGSLARYLQSLLNVCYHVRSVMQRVRQRRDFGVLRAFRARTGVHRIQG